MDKRSLMAYPRHYYGDPLNVVIGEESKSIGCRACKFDRLERGKRGCAWEIGGYPDLSSRECRNWRKKGD